MVSTRNGCPLQNGHLGCLINNSKETSNEEIKYKRDNFAEATAKKSLGEPFAWKKVLLNSV